MTIGRRMLHVYLLACNLSRKCVAVLIVWCSDMVRITLLNDPYGVNCATIIDALMLTAQHTAQRYSKKESIKQKAP